MTEETASAANLDRFAMLTTKIERESRFTRSLVVICTVANIGVFFFGLTQIYEGLPTLILGHFMEHLTELVYQSRAIMDRTPGLQGTFSGGAKAPAAK